MFVQSPQMPEEGIKSPGTPVKEGCEPPSGWGLNPGPPKEQPVCLTTEPSLQKKPSRLCWK